MTAPSPRLLIAPLLVACSMQAQETERDPYFQPTPAESTPYMPRVIIRNMEQDRSGNVWFASFGGPIRYDGKTFTNFGAKTELEGSRVFAVRETRAGVLWFGSVLHGAARYDGESVVRLTREAPEHPRTEGQVHDRAGLPHDCISWIFEDRDENVWFGTQGGLGRFDGESTTVLTTKDGLIHDSVYAIDQDAEGRLWIGTQGGVCCYDGKKFTNLADEVGRTFQNVRAIVVDEKGAVWFGGHGGAYRFDGDELTTYTTKDGLLQDFVGSMIIDRKGNVWFGHPGGFPNFQGGGATRFDGKIFTPFDREKGLTLDTVYCLLEDKDGNIWFGSAGDGACRWDGTEFRDFSKDAPTRR